MEVAHHYTKFRRLLVTKEKLDPSADFDLWFWINMTAATHAVNAALHASGVTKDHNSYPYHVLGLYVLPEKTPDGWKKSPMPLGDIVHTTRPNLPTGLSRDLSSAFSALRVLEDMRDPFIRGSSPVTAFVVASCEYAFIHCLKATNEILKWRLD